MVPAGPAYETGWPKMFGAAFNHSRNPMALLDEERRIIDLNGAWVSMLGRPRSELVGHPVHELLYVLEPADAEEWHQALEQGEFSGNTALCCGDGRPINVQWAATVEQVTGRRLVLIVALSTSQWGRAARGVAQPGMPENAKLSPRELEVVRLVSLGLSSREIADELHIAHDTARTHARNAMTKVAARSRAHLVAKAIGAGMVLPAALGEQIPQA